MSILRADSIRDRAGTGAPDFPNGLTGNLTGTATTATTATSATGLAAGAIGIDLTLSGDLTVNGTTTTIDTAITEVDSLNVEGSVGIGTTNPTTLLEVGSQNSSAAATVTISRGEDIAGGTGPKIDLKHGPASGTQRTHEIYSFQGDLVIEADSNENMEFHTGGSESLRITSGGTAIFKAGLAEKSNRVAGTLGANPNNSITAGNIIFFAGGSESGNLTINFTDIHANLAEHECCSFTVVISPNGSGVITTVTIDGQTPADGLKWSGGSAPSAGASGVDIYTFTIRKYGTGNTNYGVYGAATNYA